ncbi:uncharacterized protein [Anabrus simplex]|uniref:uncharacterized protein n=1 Tax=Anabrus simplex TaxID=316456 RepID=UPI0035A2FEAE
MAISVTPLRTSCNDVVGETIFEDVEFEKQIRKKYSWWLPVALPCRLRDSPLTDHSISGKLSSDVALWLVELRHANDSDDLTGLKLRVECENTSTDKWHLGRGESRYSVELETADERDSDTSGDLYVLSGQQIVEPDLSSADVVVDDRGVVLDQENHNSTEIIPFTTPQIEHTECDEDIPYQSKELDSTVSAFSLGEEIDGTTGGGVHQSWTANPCYTAVTVGGVKWQCRGDCYREREARFRKLCQSVLEELGRTLNNELDAFCPQSSEVECLKCGIFESDKIPVPESNISDRQAHYSLKTEGKSTAPSLACRSNSESSNSDISVVLVVKSESFMNEIKSTDGSTSTVCVNEPSCQALFTATDNNRDFSLSEGSNQCNTANPLNNKCDDVLHDLENIMHCLQGMEDSYASRNSEFVECQENQDVEFLLLCNNADNLITETLECYKSQWIPNRKEKPVSEANSNISDDVFLSPISKSDETDVFLNDTAALEVKEHYNFNINDIFDDGTKPPIPPLRRKKKEKNNVVVDSSPGQAISVGVKTLHEIETVNLHDCHNAHTCTLERKSVVGVPDDGETLLVDSQYNLLFTETTIKKDKACSCAEYPDLCSTKQLISMSSAENIIVPNKCDLGSDSNVSVTCGEPVATTILENDSYSHSSLLEVAVPQAIPVSSFEFPPCSESKGEGDEISNSVERTGKERIRPVVSLQDFASNIYEDIYPSYNSLDRSRKGSGSSDIAAWKNELQRSGFFSQGDDCLQSDEVSYFCIFFIHYVIEN